MKEKGPKTATGPASTGSSDSQHRQPPTDQTITGMSSFQLPADSSAGSSTQPNQPAWQRSRSIKADESLDLCGPLEINGSVQSGASIRFVGDFVVGDKVDAYGAITMNGNITVAGRIKAYGNIRVNGRLVASDKVQGYGKLRVVGTLEGTELEIYGNLSVNGHLKCKKLVVYGSLTLIGPESSYTVEEREEVAGAKLRREQEADWDW